MILRALLALTCSSASLTAADVLLRLAPDNDSRVITRLDSSHKAFKNARPVKDAELAANGWLWTEVSATVTGHVPTERLAKDFSIQPGTIIRAKANRSARVLTVVERYDAIEVDTSTATPEWTRVRFNKAVPVYYVSGAIPETSAMDLQAKPAVGSGPASYTDPSELPPEKVIWRRIEVDSIYDPQPFEKKRHGSTVLVQETVPVLPAPKPEPVAPQALVDTAAEQSRSAPQRPEASDTIGSTTLSGTLLREYREGNPYSLQLVEENGRRSYVDISKVFINDLRPYLNENVQISGTTRPLVVGSEDRVIEVQEIKLAE